MVGRFVLPAVFLVLFAACSSKPAFEGFDYDPPGATDTRIKPVLPPSHHVFPFDSAGITFRSDFPAGRLSGVQFRPDSFYQLSVRPEFFPVNNSPWYSFSVDANAETLIPIHLTYEGGRHRYWPKTSLDGLTWTPVPSSAIIKRDSTLRFMLSVPKGRTWVSAQEIRTPALVRDWITELPRKTVQRRIIGRSKNRNVIWMLRVGSKARPTYRIVIMGRQHPPEVPGDLALEHFVKTLATSDSDTAKKFRALCEVLVIPVLNPDGVVNGHWRLSAGGADLNRDWGPFHQVETNVARKALTRWSFNQPKTILSLDFHSTGDNIFYPINADIPKPNGAIVDDWITRISEADPEWKFKNEPFDLSAPIFKNWACLTLGCDGLTYEVGDRTDRAELKRQSELAARLLMQLILEKYGTTLRLPA
jgi:hypothetical protein